MLSNNIKLKLFGKKEQNKIKILTNFLKGGKVSTFFTKKHFKNKSFFFLNKFVIYFLENFFKKCIVLNIKKGSNKLILKQISLRKFYTKYFKKNLKVSKQILGILYYSFLLKDTSIFSNFFKKVMESSNLKMHKKILLGLKKIIDDIFKPIFNFFSLYGVFFSIKGKIGVGGNAKKRRYFFFLVSIH